MSTLKDSVFGSRALWLLALAIALVFSVTAVWWGGLNQDEGWYLYAAQLVRSGKLPYRDFFFTQGPTMPLVYSFFAPLWMAPGSVLHGLLGGRIFTLLIGFGGIFAAIALVQRLVPAERRGAASLAVFSLLGCNLYHLYFITIPKTYSLGTLFVLVGFLFIVVGVKSQNRIWRSVILFFGGLSLAFASGTRISLVLILPVVGISLLIGFRHFRWAFVWFGIGGFIGLAITYGLFAMDPASLRGLLAAQEYHAARGGFDSFFAIGSVSRLVRGYLSLGAAFVVAVGFAVSKMSQRKNEANASSLANDHAMFLLSMIAASFLAVFLLQISAPFPYDDYQVPVMGLLTVVAAALVVRMAPSAYAAGLTAAGLMLVTAAVSFGSPLLQQWAVVGHDRFWTIKKTQSDLDGLRKMAREINTLDPDGKTILTQDLYLAVETGRTVPTGLEMGPFSYFPEMSTKDARAIHVLSTEDMEELLVSASCPVAAFSGYGFAVAAPKMYEIPFGEQKRLFEVLKRGYTVADIEYNFGQNATTLVILKKREADISK